MAATTIHRAGALLVLGATAVSSFVDILSGGNDDSISVQTGSPSAPPTPVLPPLQMANDTDDAFIDVLLNY